MATSQRRAAGLALSVPAASIGTNIISYALLLTAAHILTRSSYGQLASLLGLLLIATVPLLALQTVAGRRAATESDHAGLLEASAVVGLISGGIVAALSPALAAFLHLSVLGPLLIAATVPSLAVLGCAQGVAQGRRQFGLLAALIAGSTGARSLGGLIGLLIGRDARSTLIGILVATTGFALAVAYHDRRQALAASIPLRDIAVEVAHAAHAHAAFLLLTSLDVLLARHVLSADSAGTYAVGSVITRAALWLPQSLVMLLFASLADPVRHRQARTRGRVLVGGVGVIVVAASAALGGLAVTVVGGAKYRSLADSAWLFALLGALLAALQLSVLVGLAQRRTAATFVLWATIVVDVVVVLGTGEDMTPTRLVATLVAVTAIATAVSFLLPSDPRPASDAPDYLVAPDGQGAGT